MITAHSLFSPPPAASTGEIFTTLLEKTGLKIESIHSRGQASPSDFWYDQSEDEWVLLARGTATLQVEGQPPVILTSGDHLLLPQNVRHRLSETSEDAVWLAIHLR